MSLDLTGQRFGMLVVQSETEPIRMRVGIWYGGITAFAIAGT